MRRDRRAGRSGGGRARRPRARGTVSRTMLQPGGSEQVSGSRFAQAPFLATSPIAVSDPLAGHTHVPAIRATTRLNMAVISSSASGQVPDDGWVPTRIQRTVRWPASPRLVPPSTALAADRGRAVTGKTPALTDPIHSSDPLTHLPHPHRGGSPSRRLDSRHCADPHGPRPYASSAHIGAGVCAQRRKQTSTAVGVKKDPQGRQRPEQLSSSRGSGALSRNWDEESDLELTRPPGLECDR